jgi:hypothetical protein
MKQISDYTSSELVKALLELSSNRKVYDKDSLAYRIGMLDHWMGLNASSLKREECLNRFKSLLNEKNVYKFLTQEWAQKQMLEHLNK